MDWAVFQLLLVLLCTAVAAADISQSPLAFACTPPRSAAAVIESLLPGSSNSAAGPHQPKIPSAVPPAASALHDYAAAENFDQSVNS